MKQILNGGIIFFLICFGINEVQAQVFWTETFGTGCNTGTIADGYPSSQGDWTVKAPATTNGNDANIWYISAAENGEGIGNCVASCGDQPTLHIGTSSSDLGATYLSGGADVTTDTKAISPTIDCSDQCSIRMTFEYIERGDATNDNLIVWYYDGSTWAVVQDTPETPYNNCSSGEWFKGTVTLPSSADNNSNVKIGFQWVNNDDNVGSNPSAAITNIQLAKYVTDPPTLICPSDTISCNPVVSYDAPYAVGDCIAPPFSITQNDGNGYTSGDTFPVGTTYQNFYVVDSMGNIASCGFNVKILETPSQAEILTPEEDFCDQQDIFLEATSPDGGNGIWSVIQGGSNIYSPSSGSTQANNLSYGTNTFVWTVSSASCGENSDTLSIEIYEPPSQAQTQDTIRLCDDTLVAIVATHPSVGNGSWSITNGTANFTDITSTHTDIYNISEGWNDVIWTVKNGICPSTTDTLRLFKKTNAEIYNSDTTVCLLTQDLNLVGSPITTEVSGGWYVVSGGAEFENQGGSSVMINHLSGGENVIVYAQSNQKCGVTSDTIIVVAKLCNEYDPIIPTMITPNGDGKNDLFIIKDLNALYPNATVKIVNRWGNLVFKSTGYAEPWNGTYMNDGKASPMGTYYYRILIPEDNKEITGTISIIR